MKSSKYASLLCIALLYSFLLSAQEIAVSVRGTVLSANGEPLAGVSIMVKGTSRGATTGADGSFSISAPANSTLVISFTGYASKEIKVGAGAQQQFHLQLDEKKNDLDQVIVVGYGTRRKSEVTGAIASVSEKAIQDVPSANLSQAMQGQAAGIDIEKSKGNSHPGQSPTILIRGTRSVKAGNGPLFIVDGIPFEGSIDDINQDDVASIEVLKDASSTAIYGSRGANGVILVTTKRGRANSKARVTYSGYAGFTKWLGEYPMMNGPQYLQLKKWATYLGNPGVYTSVDDPNLINGSLIALAPEERQGIAMGRSTDWQKLVYKTGISTDHQLGVLGGTDNTQYAMGAGYYDEKGVYPGQEFTRYTLKLSVDQKLGNYIKVGLSSLNTYSITRGESVNPMGQALRASPLVSPYDSTGKLINNFLPGSANQVWNPLADFLPGNSVENRNRLGTFSTVYVELSPMKDLKYRFNGGAEVRSDVYGNFYGRYSTYNLGVQSTAENATTQTTSYTLENLLIYDKTIARLHKVNFTGLYSFQKYSSQNQQFNYTSVLSDQAQYLNPALGSNFQATNNTDNSNTQNGAQTWVLISYMGRLNYTFNDKYLLTFTMRSDGSSRLAPGNKYHVFPSAAVAWNVIKERWLQSHSWLTNLRLRASYGEVGNPAIGAYQTLGSLATQTYNYGSTNTTGLYPYSSPNPNLNWEYTATANVGVDFGFFQNRLSGGIDLYHSYTRDMIMPVTLPASSGIPAQILTNIGKSENKGIEVHVAADIIQPHTNHGVSWSADVNFYLDRGEITQLLPSITTTLDGKPADIANKWFVGRPIGSFYDYVRTGIWQATSQDSAAAKALGQTITGPKSVIGQAKILDRNHNGQIDAGDEAIVGTPQPSWEAGMTQRIAYRGFDLTVVAFARVGGTIESALFGAGFAATMQGNYNNVNVPYWTPKNPTNRWSSPNSAQTNPPYHSTFAYFDGSFLKIRSMTLGYTLPVTMVKTIGMRSVRFYATAKDPFILFSPYRNTYHGIDPELTGTTDNLNTPATWSMLFGVNVGF
ncbi:SusC/RagA family TonB-linked outer membrane protein [Puia dinghuensis]|uniref:SusC/RagA family TonB-linked outer membrane protein n=1 Tax=Puia dinghuensis TaxID=1792502 RepID=A0A8J2UC86_9BACT|nr:TonB-dependent receptor [Puia dinghuensis]GGA95456.1 SusC/RagA family TonB-linked outer membrane protein [Puia dinghuensis]